VGFFLMRFNWCRVGNNFAEGCWIRQTTRFLFRVLQRNC
jgi:hypothetical protein